MTRSPSVIRLAVSAAALLSAAMATAQTQPAGKVLVVAGAATLERAGRQVALQPGTTVESGDVLAVGERSALQVRFSDESIVALRANSQFRIEDYRFAGNAESDRSLMGLLKGGMRTITGLIGKASPKNYGVRTATATIGIRGTHFTVVSCNNDCVRADGSRELNGTFGGVTDGRISVRNDVGEQEFGQQDYFHVPSADAPPIRLLAPPATLNDRSVPPRARAAAPASSSGDTTASAEGTSSSSGTGTSTSPQPTEQAAPSTELIVPLTEFAATSQPAVVAQSGRGITVVEVQNATGTSIEANARNYTLLELQAEVKEVQGITFYNAAGLASALQSVGRSVGSNAAAGVYWLYDAPSTGSTNLSGQHHAWGDTPLISLPGSGTAQYNYVGGTAPTDNFGRVGTLTGSNLLMDFTNQQIKTASAMTLSFGTNAAQTASTTYSIPANTTWAMGGGPSSLAGTSCTAGCATSTTTTGSINGRFVGGSLEGYVGAITVRNTQLLGSGQANTAGGVAAFAKQ